MTGTVLPLARLQADLLVAAATGRPLPGGASAPLADAHLAVDEDGVVAVDPDTVESEALDRLEQTLAGEAAGAAGSGERAPRGVRPVRTVDAPPGSFLLRCLPLERSGDEARLGAEVWGAPPGGQPGHSLEQVRVVFRLHGDEWRPSPPTRLAT